MNFIISPHFCRQKNRYLVNKLIATLRAEKQKVDVVDININSSPFCKRYTYLLCSSAENSTTYINVYYIIISSFE